MLLAESQRKGDLIDLECCREWIDLIVSYNEGKYKQEDCLYSSNSYEIDGYIGRIIDNIEVGGPDDRFLPLIWNASYLVKENRFNTAKDAYRRALEEDFEQIELTDNVGHPGQSLHIQLSHCSVIYDDYFHQVKLTMNDETAKYLTGEFLLSGSCVNSLYTVDLDALNEINNGLRSSLERAKEILAKKDSPYHDSIVSAVRYVCNTMIPIVNFANGFSGDSEIYMPKEDEIDVKFLVSMHWYIYQESQTFSVTDDFEYKFNAWWKFTLMKLLKFLKAKASKIEQTYLQ